MQVSLIPEPNYEAIRLEQKFEEDTEPGGSREVALQFLKAWTEAPTGSLLAAVAGQRLRHYSEKLYAFERKEALPHFRRHMDHWWSEGNEAYAGLIAVSMVPIGRSLLFEDICELICNTTSLEILRGCVMGFVFDNPKAGGLVDTYFSWGQTHTLRVFLLARLLQEAESPSSCSSLRCFILQALTTLMVLDNVPMMVILAFKAFQQSGMEPVGTVYMCKWMLERWPEVTTHALTQTFPEAELRRLMKLISRE